MLAEARKSGPFFPDVITSLQKRLQNDGWRMAILVSVGGEILSGAEDVVAAAELVANGLDDFQQIPIMVAQGWTAGHIKSYTNAMRRGDPPAAWSQMMGFDAEWVMNKETLCSLRWMSDDGKKRTEEDPRSECPEIATGRPVP